MTKQTIWKYCFLLHEAQQTISLLADYMTPMKQDSIFRVREREEVYTHIRV